MMNGVDYTVVGILPAGFRFISEADVYTPLGRVETHDRSVHGGILCIGRLKPEVTAEQAQADMHIIQNSLNQLYPRWKYGISKLIVSFLTY